MVTIPMIMSKWTLHNLSRSLSLTCGILGGDELHLQRVEHKLNGIHTVVVFVPANSKPILNCCMYRVNVDYGEISNSIKSCFPRTVASAILQVYNHLTKRSTMRRR